MKPIFLKLVFLASNTNQTREIGGNNDCGLSERRYHEDDILSKRRSSRVKKKQYIIQMITTKVIRKIQGLNMTKWLF